MANQIELPVDLLKTFQVLLRTGGDATAAATELKISQPAISKRLAALRKLSTAAGRQPWIVIRGKRWELTPEGERMQPQVAGLLSQYEHVQQQAAGGPDQQPVIHIACGQQAAASFVQAAVQQFCTEDEETLVRLSTVRGAARIEGVAAGRFDLAVITGSTARVRQVGGLQLHCETLLEDQHLLAARPAAGSKWKKAWQQLVSGVGRADRVIGKLPFILPERNANLRIEFDEWFIRNTGSPPRVVVETGGWQVILRLAAAGVGVGLATTTALAAFNQSARSKLTHHPLNRKSITSGTVSVIARRQGRGNSLDITSQTDRLLSYLKESAQQYTDLVKE